MARVSIHATRSAGRPPGCFNPRPRAGGDARPGGGGHDRLRVSIHAPARGATRRISGRRRFSVFQSTPPRGGRRVGEMRVQDGPAGFNPRPRAGGDRRRMPLEAAVLDRFQSTPPRGGRLGLYTRTAGAEFQSTPPRGGRPGSPLRSVLARQVSIHAPARGATSVYAAPAARIPAVSIHAPARGATGAPGVRGIQPPRVSIHAPARGATGTPACRRGSGPVSIHAPARGATREQNAVPQVGSSFNPRPRAGGDMSMARAAAGPKVPFQSTPPRGGRRRAGVRAANTGGFNPRPRAGGDLAHLECEVANLHVFQSTPPRGGRPAGAGACPRPLDCFNPRPRAGGDLSTW